MLSPIYRLGLHLNVFLYHALRLDAPCTLYYIYAMFRGSTVVRFTVVAVPREDAVSRNESKQGSPRFAYIKPAGRPTVL